MKVKCVAPVGCYSECFTVGNIYEVLKTYEQMFISGIVEVIDDDGQGNCLFKEEYEVVEE